MPAVPFKRKRIAFLVNLRHGLLGGAVQLEFHHIDETVRLQHQVNAPVRSVTLCIDVESQQFVNDEKHILIVQLQVTHQLVRGICKETAKTAEERVNVSGTQLLHELLYLERSLHFIEPGIERYQKLDEALFYLPVREAETIKAELLVIALYGEIPTLKNHRNRVFVTVDAIQNIGISLYVCHTFQIIMITL